VGAMAEFRVSLPEGLETLVIRLARQQGISPTQYIRSATACQAGYDARTEADTTELNRLGAWATQAESRLDVIEGILRIRRR